MSMFVHVHVRIQTLCSAISPTPKIAKSSHTSTYLVDEKDLTQRNYPLKNSLCVKVVT